MKRLAIALLAIGACKARDPGDGLEEALVQMATFADMACRCTDKACGLKVQQDMARWSEQMARQASAKTERIDEETTKKFADVAKKFSDCMTKALSLEPTPFPLDLPALVDKPVSADAQIRLVRDRAARLQKNLVLTRLEVSYVRSDGTLDPSYGVLELELRPGTPADDPNRPIGAPVPPPVAPTSECQGVRLETPYWKQYQPSRCAAERLEAPRCNIVQIWSRAQRDNAPVAALATVKLAATESTPPQTWTFEISDPPRKIEINRSYPDDCEPVLEKKQ